MTFLAGDIITAARLNRLQPASYYAIGSGTVVGSLTNADVPSATLPILNATVGATYMAWCAWDANVTSASAGTLVVRMAIDGVAQAPNGTYNSPTNLGRGQPVNFYMGTLSTTITHTFKLIASPLAGQVIQGVNCSIMVQILEVV
jgi:hypothetical protein